MNLFICLSITLYRSLTQLSSSLFYKILHISKMSNLFISVQNTVQVKGTFAAKNRTHAKCLLRNARLVRPALSTHRSVKLPSCPEREREECADPTWSMRLWRKKSLRKQSPSRYLQNHLFLITPTPPLMILILYQILRS